MANDTRPGEALIGPADSNRRMQRVVIGGRPRHVDLPSWDVEHVTFRQHHHTKASAFGSSGSARKGSVSLSLTCLHQELRALLIQPLLPRLNIVDRVGRVLVRHPQVDDPTILLRDVRRFIPAHLPARPCTRALYLTWVHQSERPGPPDDMGLFGAKGAWVHPDSARMVECLRTNAFLPRAGQ